MIFNVDKQLLLDAPHRWDSTFCMAERFILMWEVSGPIYSSLVASNNTPLGLLSLPRPQPRFRNQGSCHWPRQIGDIEGHCYYPSGKYRPQWPHLYVDHYLCRLPTTFSSSSLQGASPSYLRLSLCTRSSSIILTPSCNICRNTPISSSRLGRWHVDTIAGRTSVRRMPSACVCHPIPNIILFCATLTLLNISCQS